MTALSISERFVHAAEAVNQLLNKMPSLDESSKVYGNEELDILIGEGEAMRKIVLGLSSDDVLGVLGMQDIQELLMSCDSVILDCHAWKRDHA